MKLPTLAERPAGPQPKPSASRLAVKVEKAKRDTRWLHAWRHDVQERDNMRCRCCHVKVVRLSVQTLHPRRAECHHLAGRDDIAVKYDSRNGVCVCAMCHEKITGKVNEKIVITGDHTFVKDGRRYLNADYPLTFEVIR